VTGNAKEKFYFKKLVMEVCITALQEVFDPPVANGRTFGIYKDPNS
jgi:hypothetical protein